MGTPLARLFPHIFCLWLKDMNASTPFVWTWVMYLGDVFDSFHHPFSPIVLNWGINFWGNSACWGSGKNLRSPTDHSILEVFFPAGLLKQNFSIPQNRGSVRFPCLCYCLGLLLTWEFSSKNILSWPQWSWFSLRLMGVVEDRMSSLTLVTSRPASSLTTGTIYWAFPVGEAQHSVFYKVSFKSHKH